MFEATETAALARQLFGPPGQEYTSGYARRRRSKKRWDAALRANLRAIWYLGDVGYQRAILPNLWHFPPREGLAFVLEALEKGDRDTRSLAPTVLDIFGVYGLTLSNDEVELIARMTRVGEDAVARVPLLDVLERSNYQQLDDLMRDLAADPNPDVRFQVNLKRLKRGEDVTQELFADLDKYWIPAWGEQDLWRERDRLKPSEVQAKMLRARMARQLKRIRAQCEKDTNPPATYLYYYLQDGLPGEPDDIDLIAGAIYRIAEARKQKVLVEAVAWFANDRARDWLRAICDSETLPKTVRNAASRELRKLEAPATHRG
jgi:hypothetical protein